MYHHKIKTDEMGYITPESLVDLTVIEWKNWIEDTIHDKSRAFYNSRYEMIKTEIFHSRIPQLPKQERYRAYQGIAQCLDEAYESRKSKNKKEWNNTSLDDLLFMVGQIETNYEQDTFVHQDNYFRNEDLLRFLKVLTPRPKVGFNGHDRDVYGRVLQSLIGIQAKLPFDFWCQELAHAPSSYASLCFVGATQNSPYDAINLLPQMDWSKQETKNQMESVLSLTFYSDYLTKPKVMAALQKMKRTLPSPAQKAIDAGVQRGKEAQVWRRKRQTEQRRKRFK